MIDMDGCEVSKLLRNEEFVNFIKANYIYFDNELIAKMANKRFAVHLDGDDISRIVRAMKNRSYRNGKGNLPRKYPRLLRKYIKKKENVIIIGNGD